MLRPENWLLGFLFSSFLNPKKGILLSRITILPLPSLTSLLKRWLNQDWERGIDNLNQLLRYSLQFIPVVEAINGVLAEIPSQQLIYRVSQLAENTDDWDLVRFSSVSLGNKMKSIAVDGFLSIFFFLRRWQENLKSRFNTEPRLDTSPHRVAAGFWYLHERQPDKAIEAFSGVRNLLYGEEMYALADILSKFSTAENVTEIASLNLPTFPNQPYLRPTTWHTLKTLSRVIEDVQLIERGTNRLARSSALNRAIGELQEIININTQQSHPQQVPKTERDLIIIIAETWQTSLQNIAKDIGQIGVWTRYAQIRT